MTIRNAVGRQYAAATTICLWVFLTVLTVTAVVIGASNEYGNRPRGVAPELASFYEEKAEFQCLSGNKQVHQATIYSKSSTKKGYESQRKLQIPFDHVNDDYCDCDDGSDEPGTAACANGSFYCKNIGFRPLTIPSNRVNDYICDCCDGSDEWDSGIECPNMCGEQGEKARAEATQLRGVQMAGYAKRVELAKAGSKLMEEKKSELEKLKQELEEIEPMKSAIEEKKNQAEEHEREAKKRQDDEWKVVKEQRRAEAAKALFVELDWDSDERLSIDEVISHAPQGRDKSIIESIFGEPPAGLDFAEFIKSFERIRDFVRKSAPPKEKSAEKAANDDESALNDGDIKGLENEGEDVEEVEEEEDEHDEELQKPPYDEATQQLISDADTVRKEHQDILDKVADLETKIKESQSFVEFEYGNDHAWAPLKDECAELTTHQYTYRLCLFDKSTQKDRNAHSETNLGYWSRWSGTEQDKFSVQMYDKGQSCWNGPERSTRVDIQCGDELQLIEADEPAKCEYRFVLKAPAACRNPEEMEREHQEL